MLAHAGQHFLIDLMFLWVLHTEKPAHHPGSGGEEGDGGGEHERGCELDTGVAAEHPPLQHVQHGP